MIRKLAREAVIFMLSAALLAAIGGFVVCYRETPLIVWLNMTKTVPRTAAQNVPPDLAPYQSAPAVLSECR
jgi:hypothetical protein